MMPVTFRFYECKNFSLKLFAVRNKMIWKEFCFRLRKRFYRMVRVFFNLTVLHP